MKKNVNAKKDITQSIGTKAPLTVFIGTIKKVYPDTMTADVYIPETAGVVFNASFLSSSLSRDQKCISIPTVNSSVIVTFIGSNSRPIIIGSFSSFAGGLSSGQLDQEILYEGENASISSGLSVSKQDLFGNISHTSNSFSNIFLNNKGKNIFISTEEERNTMSSSKKEGFSISDINKDTRDLNVRSLYEFNRKIDFPYNIYSDDEIDESSIDDIITSSKKIIEIIRGSDVSKGYSDKVREAKDVLKTYTSDTQKVSDVESFLSSLILKKSGSTLEVQIGGVSSDSETIPKNLDTNEEGNQILFSLKVKGEDGFLKGKIEIDDEGNINIDMNNLKLP